MGGGEEVDEVMGEVLVAEEEDEEEEEEEEEEAEEDEEEEEEEEEESLGRIGGGATATIGASSSSASQVVGAGAAEIFGVDAATDTATTGAVFDSDTDIDAVARSLVILAPSFASPPYTARASA
jgi:hypothetical protein